MYVCIYVVIWFALLLFWFTVLLLVSKFNLDTVVGFFYVCSIIISGAERFSTHTGYGHTVAYGGEFVVRGSLRLFPLRLLPLRLLPYTGYGHTVGFFFDKKYGGEYMVRSHILFLTLLFFVLYSTLPHTGYGLIVGYGGEFVARSHILFLCSSVDRISMECCLGLRSYSFHLFPICSSPIRKKLIEIKYNQFINYIYMHTPSYSFRMSWRLSE